MLLLDPDLDWTTTFTRPICSVVLHCSICGERAQHSGSNAEVQIAAVVAEFISGLHNK
jgi:hypothetical protein